MYISTVYNFCKVDLEPSVIDDVKSGPLGSLFNSNLLVSGNEEACTFARGHYTIGKQIIDQVNDKLRKLVDNCDNVMGFIMTSSISGGTGSGVGVLILEQLCVDYKKRAKVGLHWLLDQIDIALAFDNESLYNICQRNLHIAKPDMSNVNRLIAKVISSMTASIRFSGELNADLDELRVNL
ncbi:alpha-tubulin II, partial [Reticulomyxa filosa]